jgi:lactate dehydrogenase-like 2-hydroxyacid dehydrogenase
MNVRIIVTHSIPPEVVELLSGTSEVIFGKFSGNCRKEVLEHVTQAHAIMLSGRDVAIDEPLVYRCPSLRIIAATFKGPDNIDIEACTRNGVWVTTIPDAPPGLSPSSPDATLGSALEAAANILEALIGLAPKGAVNSPLLTRRRRATHVERILRK